MNQELQYLKLLKKVYKVKKKSKNRTDIDSFSQFGAQMRFDLSKEFPLITTKKIHWKSIVMELIWLLRGETNVTFLKKHQVRIWDEWADAKGDLGPVYGKQWRKWESFKLIPKCLIDSKFQNYKHIGTSFHDVLPLEILHCEIDQLKNVIERLKTNPECRRLIISAWNVSDLSEMALPPCHSFFQFSVIDGVLDLQLYQRSADMFLGVPFNIASYALLLHLVANECNLKVGSFVHTLGNYHLYDNLRDQAGIQLSRAPMKLPTVKINLAPGELMKFIDQDVSEMEWKDIQKLIVLENYVSHEKLDGKVAI